MNIPVAFAMHPIESFQIPLEIVWIVLLALLAVRDLVEFTLGGVAVNIVIAGRQ